MVVFRPFVGEVLKGRIVSCTEEHIRGASVRLCSSSVAEMLTLQVSSPTVSMDFVQDIIIPSYALQTPSYLCVSHLLIAPFVIRKCADDGLVWLMQ